MPRVRPLEVKALVPLLRQDWDSVEDLAKALIEALDEARTSRTSYVAVVEFPIGNTAKAGYIGVGPFPGAASADKAIQLFPPLQDPKLTRGFVIVPTMTLAAYEKLLRELDAVPDKAA